MKYIFEEYLKKVKNSFSSFSTEEDPSNWPSSWKEITYKNYKRFKNIPLKKLDFEYNILEALKRRASNGFEVTDEITFSKLSTILNYSVCKKGTSIKRYYPSAGARYPLEFYVIVNTDMDEINKGVYHLNIKDNSLTYLWSNPLEGEEIFGMHREKNLGSIYIICTSVIQRSSVKYGELALKFSYIEAGTAFQNIALLATVFNIANSISNHDDVKLEKILDIDGETEFVVGAMSLGFPKILK